MTYREIICNLFTLFVNLTYVSLCCGIDTEFVLSTLHPCLTVGSTLVTNELSHISCSLSCLKASSCKGVLYNQADGICDACASYGMPGQPPYSATPLFRTTKGNQCNTYLVEEIPDSHFSASSEYTLVAWDHGPERARLSSVDIGQPQFLIGGWQPIASDTNQYIQAQFQGIKEIMKIVTMGRYASTYFVETYTVSYSMDCASFTFVKDHNNVIKVFTGNTDAAISVTQDLPQPILALCIRLHPLTWHDFIAMRFDTIGCDW